MLRRLAPAVFIGVAVALASGGCGSHGPVVREREQYQGPAITIDSTGPAHILVLTTPSAGWEVTFDRSRQALGVTEVYVTARQPNPAYMHAQGQVTQRVGTGVESGKAVRALVRVVQYNLPANDFAYRVAAEK